MNYSRQLLLSMAIPTAMVAGAGSSVAAGAVWLARVARHADAAQVAAHLGVAVYAVAALTALCVACCVLFTVSILRRARAELGGEPAEARRALAAFADGRLDGAVPPAAAGSLMHSLARVQQALQEMVRTIQQSADHVRLASGEIASGNLDLSGRTEQAAANLQETAGSMQRLATGVGQTAESARRVHELAEAAAHAAGRGGTVVADVLASMQGIHDASRRIGEIIGTIDGIAFQTNILALNAAVEAARAGEQGRGFAVVAGEVRTLAQRSAAAAREVRTLIGASLEQTQAGHRLVGDAGGAMLEIVTGIDRVRRTIAEITAASGEQSTGIGVVNRSVSLLEQMTQHNAALVEQSAAAAASLQQQAERLAAAAGRFRLARAAN